jgi:HD-GYP domain-containing protein (c-di-GMP phosphodiesterase class II)
LPTTGLRLLRRRDLERAARRRTRDLLVKALGEHQDHLHRHSAGVATLARAVGRRLGLEPVELREVIHAAELHDVGKLALPDEILDKQGPLDDEEWKLVRQHTVVGERMVAALPAIAGVGPLVRSCHERWDGRGYPDGLAGEEIPLASRIVFACDAFDAMTSARPYQRRPKRWTEALGELERCAGTQFDHRVVWALVEELASSGGAERGEGAMVGG